MGFDNLVLPIQADENMGCYVEILERLKDQMDAMLSHHCKILIIRFDLHLNYYTGDNKRISQYVRKLRKRLKSKFGFKRIGFLWVREIEKAKQQHYHFVLMLDGNKVQQASHVLTLVESCWTRWGEPKPYTPKNCYYRVARGDMASFQGAFYRCSYLAKIRGKGYKDKAANDYSASRIICG